MRNTEAMSLETKLMLLDYIDEIANMAEILDGGHNLKSNIVQAIDYLVPALTIEHDSTFMNIMNSVLTDGNCIPTNNYDEVDDAIEHVFNSHIHEDNELESSEEAIQMFNEFRQLPKLYESMSYTTVLFYIFYCSGRTYNDDFTLLDETLVKSLIKAVVDTR